MGQLPHAPSVKVLWLLPQRPAGAPSGGDLYDSLVIAGLKRLGHEVQVRSSLPAPEKVHADVVVQDALGFRTFLPFNRALARLGNQARRVALVHVTSARLGANTGVREARYLASTQAAVFVSEQARAESLRLLIRADPSHREVLRELPSAVVSPGADRLPSDVARMQVVPELRLLCVGHLSEHKGQLELLEVFARCKGLNASLFLVGGGHVDHRYTAQIVSRLRGIPRAHWLGPLKPHALAGELQKADVFINASQYESWGMAAAEAQAAGLPVVSWSRGGLWEFLTPGVDSLRARRPGPGVLRRLVDPGLLARLAAGARRAPKRTWAGVAAEFASFLETERT